MGEQNSGKPPDKEQANLETLIQMEWDIINILHKKLKDPDLTVTEWTRAANALAYHMSNLNKMLSQKGETSQFTEQNLGDFIKGIEPRIFRRIKRDFSIWTRRLSSKRY
ncbi:MAG: hypothetical protein NWE99_10605 [Candidatus Bathyarchaeota archaeon]|nr:hypothetical protein [Candidatus Bathyarchaeota archaeon]